MAADSKNDIKEFSASTDPEIKKAKKKKGLLSRLWSAIFRLHGDNFEKRLQYISKEEAAILSRITRRSTSWRRITRHLILFSMLLEAIAVGYAIMTTRSLDLNWKVRALRFLPMFLLPLVSSITYFILRGFTRMFDQKDRKKLEKLRIEWQAKIDELKERTNYYTTQQLIQKYDPDPAAKAAAATALASKLGSDSGLKVFVGDDSQPNVSNGKSNDLEVAKTSGLRNRKPPPSNNSTQNTSTHHISKRTPNQMGLADAIMSQQHQLVVEHGPQTGSSMHDGGWITRVAALLVGEDLMQSCALICGNCNMHNGLARKEEFPYIRYYCPHCHALNQSKQSERVSGSNSSSRTPSVVEDADVHIADAISESNSTVAAVKAISGS